MAEIREVPMARLGTSKVMSPLRSKVDEETVDDRGGAGEGEMEGDGPFLDGVSLALRRLMVKMVEAAKVLCWGRVISR